MNQTERPSASRVLADGLRLQRGRASERRRTTTAWRKERDAHSLTSVAGHASPCSAPPARPPCSHPAAGRHPLLSSPRSARAGTPRQLARPKQRSAGERGGLPSLLASSSSHLPRPLLGERSRVGEGLLETVNTVRLHVGGCTVQWVQVTSSRLQYTTNTVYLFKPHIFVVVD